MGWRELQDAVPQAPPGARGCCGRQQARHAPRFGRLAWAHRPLETDGLQRGRRRRSLACASAQFGLAAGTSKARTRGVCVSWFRSCTFSTEGSPESRTFLRNLFSFAFERSLRRLSPQGREATHSLTPLAHELDFRGTVQSRCSE